MNGFDSEKKDNTIFIVCHISHASQCSNMNSEDIIEVRRAIAKVSRNFHILQANGDFVWWEDDFSWNLFADTEKSVAGGVAKINEKNIRATCDDGKPQPKKRSRPISTTKTMGLTSILATGPITGGYTACQRKQTNHQDFLYKIPDTLQEVQRTMILRAMTNIVFMQKLGIHN